MHVEQTASFPAGASSADSAATFAALEKQRRRALYSFWRTIILLAFGLPLIALPFRIFLWIDRQPAESLADVIRLLQQLAELHPEPVFITAFFWPLVCLAVAFWSFRRYALIPKWDYLRDFKAQVFTSVCRQNFPTIGFQPERGMSWKVLDYSGLFPFACDTYTSEDRFSGEWGDTEVAFAEAEAKRKRRKMTSDGLDTVYEVYFRGLVFVADFHKHFHSTTRIVPNGAKVNKGREKPAKLESLDFSRLFDTWTTDQVDVRYILSSSMLEKFVALNRRFPGLRARFHKETLLLLLPSARNRFEPSLYRQADCSAQLSSFVDDVRVCLAVVDELNLNTRIWSKR